jgi:hypothetical protein
MAVLVFQVPFWKMVVAVQLTLLISRESTLSMSSCHQEASTAEESLSSVWLYSRDLVGTCLTTAMLNLSGTVKDKDVTSSILNAVAAVLNLMSSVLEVPEDALQMESVVAHAQVTLLWTVASSLDLLRTTFARMITELIMPDFLTYKSLEEVLGASASLVLLTPDHLTVLLHSASSIPAMEVALLLLWMFILEVIKLPVLLKAHKLLMDTMDQLTVLTH